MNQYARGNYGNSRGYGDNSGDRQPYENKFPNSGALFPTKEKRSSGSPDMQGNIEISEDVLDYILREAERGTKVKLELAAWIKMSRNNTSFTSLSIKVPYDVRLREQGNPTYQQRPNYNQRQRERPAPQQQAPRQNVRQSYAEQSGRVAPPPPQERLPRYGSTGPADPEFARGDRMPDWGRPDPSDPNAPPF
jgi:hypothetical protein